MTRTHVDNECYIFASDLEVDRGYRATIAVQWMAFNFTASPASLLAIDSFLTPRHEVSEVWFVFPEDVSPSMEHLATLDEFKNRTSALSLVEFRFFAVSGDGDWTETAIEPSPRNGAVPLTDNVKRDLQLNGMRQVFRDTVSLATASAGFHFERPGRSHSEVFMRTSQSVARAQHAYFIAACLLTVMAPSPGSRLFADTGGVNQLLHAVRDLWHRAGADTTNIVVDTFGSYEGYERNLRYVRGRDWVIISSSSSGSLARQLLSNHRAEHDRTITVFYLSSTPPDPHAGLTLCDLTLPAAEDVDSVRDPRIRPPATYRVDQGAVCALCAEGSHPIELVGDSFFPAPTELKLRMPSLLDRPLNQLRGESRPRPTVHFDNQEYFTDLYGLAAIVGPGQLTDPNAADTAPQYGVSTRVAHLMDEAAWPAAEHVRKHVMAKVRKALADTPEVSAVVTLGDDESLAISGSVARLLFGADVELAAPRMWVPAGRQDPSSTLQEGLGTLPVPSSVLVCVGTIGSGRALLALNRELRGLAAAVETRYFVTASHPESVNAEEIFLQSLGLRGPSTKNNIQFGWKLPRDPRTPGAANAWSVEYQVLGEVDIDLVETWTDYRGSAEAQAIKARTTSLSNLDEALLFAAPAFCDHNLEGIRAINPKFALWPEDWATLSRTAELGCAPTQAEIYATIAHYLYESRRSNPNVAAQAGGIRRHGYAINPAIFDRLNDPQIQAAILRAVEPGELDYHADYDASRAAAEVIRFVIKNIDDEGGQAAYEFLLSLVHGLLHPGSSGLRIQQMVLNESLVSLKEKTSNFTTLPPLCRALVRVLWSRSIGPFEEI